MVRHAIFLNGAVRATIIQPAISTWRPSNNVSWQVREVNCNFVNDGQTDVAALPLVDSYSKPVPRRQVPCTDYRGSWAESMDRARGVAR